MSTRLPHSPYVRFLIGESLIPASDSRHPDHGKWLRDREEDRRFFLDPKNDRRKPRPHVPRPLRMEPLWETFVWKGESIPPSHDHHPQHELWREWQFDVSLDSPLDKKRRLAEQEAHHAAMALRFPQLKPGNRYSDDPMEEARCRQRNLLARASREVDLSIIREYGSLCHVSRDKAVQAAFDKLSPDQQLYWRNLMPAQFGSCVLSEATIAKIEDAEKQPEESESPWYLRLYFKAMSWFSGK